MRRCSHTTARTCLVAVVPDALPTSALTKSTRALLRSQIRRLVELPYGSSCRSFALRQLLDRLMPYVSAIQRRMISSVAGDTPGGRGWPPRRESGRPPRTHFWAGFEG